MECVDLSDSRGSVQSLYSLSLSLSVLSLSLSLTTQTLSQPPTSKSELSIEVQVLQVPVFCFTMYLNICWLPKRVEVARNLSIFYSFKRYFQFNRKNYLSKFFIFNFFVSIYFMLTCKYLGSC